MNKQINYYITHYHKDFEDSWIRCKALSYLYSRFNDQIEAKKDTYSSERLLKKSKQAFVSTFINVLVDVFLV